MGCGTDLVGDERLFLGNFLDGGWLNSGCSESGRFFFGMGGFDRNGFGVAEEEQEREHQQKNDGHDPESLNEREHGGLRLHHAVKHAERFAVSGVLVEPFGEEAGLGGVKHLPGDGAAGGDVLDQAALMELRAAGKEGGHDGDAEAAADVAHEVENAGGVAHFFFGDTRHAESHERDEEEAEGGALQDLRPENVPVAGVEVEVREAEHGDGAENEAENEQTARIGFASEIAGERRGGESADTARGKSEAGVVSGIAEKSLEIDGQKNEAGVKHEAEQADEENAGAEGAVSQGAKIDDRLFGHEFANDQRDKTGDAANGKEANVV